MLDGKTIVFPHISGVNQGDLLYNLFEHSQGTIPNMNSISLFLSSVSLSLLLSQLCQNPHPNYSVGVGAPAHNMGFLLF